MDRGPVRFRRGPFFVPERKIMECAVAIQILPVDAVDDDEVCRVVDEVIDFIREQPVTLFVGPFESTFEGDYDTCMDVLRQCQLVAHGAGSNKIMAYAKIDYRPQGDLLRTDTKVGKYQELNSASGIEC